MMTQPGSFQRISVFVLILAAVLAGWTAAHWDRLPEVAVAAEPYAKYPNTTWVLLCTALVVMMQLGFALLEAGLVDAKIVVSVLYKNLLDFCAGVFMYSAVGYWIQFGEWPLASSYALLEHGPYAMVHPYAHFIYQAAFATTATTICSGAMAGRMKLSAYVVYTMFITGFLYPMAGRVIWVWLQPAGLFHDLAGSIGVHTVGGAAAYVGAKLLGPRQDRTAIPHSIPLAISGMFLLFVGWYGFNMGSVGLNVLTTEGRQLIAKVGFNTTLAGAMAGLVSWRVGYLFNSPKLSVSMNGVLGGLVAITCSADVAHPLWALAVGSMAGAAVSIYGAMLERKNMGKDWFDDPVGAVPVHLLCGILGGLSAAMLPPGDVFRPDGSEVPAVLKTLQESGRVDPRLIQLAFTLAIPATIATLMAAAMYKPFKKGWLRVQPEVEHKGIDRSVYEEEAYDFQNSPQRLGDLKLGIQTLLKQADEERDASFDHMAAYPAHVIYRMAPFKRDFSDWLSKAERLIASYDRWHGDLKVRHEGKELTSLLIRTNVENEIEALKALARTPATQRKGPFQLHLDEITKQLENLRRMVEAQIAAESKAASDQIEQIQGDLDRLSADFQASLEGGEFWVTRVEELTGQVEELKATLDRILLVADLETE